MLVSGPMAIISISLGLEFMIDIILLIAFSFCSLSFGIYGPVSPKPSFPWKNLDVSSFLLSGSADPLYTGIFLLHNSTV